MAESENGIVKNKNNFFNINSPQNRKCKISQTIKFNFSNIFKFE